MSVRLYGTSYLNIHRELQYIDYIHQAMYRYGVNNPISRLSDFEAFSILEAVESKIANDLGVEKAVLFSSGSLAAICLKSYLEQKVIHNSIVYSNNFHPSWKSEKMVSFCNKHIKQENLFVTNSLNAFFGKKENYMTYKNCFKMIAVDISHTIYIWNHKEEYSENMLFFGSLNKAPSFPAGFIAGLKKDIQEIKKMPEYTTSTPPSVAFAQAFLQTQKLREVALQRLKAHMAIFNTHFKLTQTFPIYNLGENAKKLYHAFEKEGFMLSFMPYPYETSPEYLRIILHAGLSRVDMDRLLAFMDKKRVKVILNR